MLRGKPIKALTHLIIPDLHFNKHCQKYVKLIEKVIPKLKPNSLCQLGDFSDCSQLSPYVRDPRDKTTARDEIEGYREQMLRWANLLPAGSIYNQVCGNHDIRVVKNMWRKAPEMAELMRTLEDMLGFKELNRVHKVKFVWHDYNDWDSCRYGDTVCTHGFYYGKNVAVSNLDKYPGNYNYVTGHCHRIQIAYNGDRWCTTIGHGSEEKLTRHMPVPTGWTQAFAILTEVDGRCSIEIVPVKDGKCILRGQQI